MVDAVCGPLRFTSTFDSGNLDNVSTSDPLWQKFGFTAPTTTQHDGDDDGDGLDGDCGVGGSTKLFRGGGTAREPHINYFLEVSPDCKGTSHENKHRSWFYFAVTHVGPPHLPEKSSGGGSLRKTSSASASSSASSLSGVCSAQGTVKDPSQGPAALFSSGATVGGVSSSTSIPAAARGGAAKATAGDGTVQSLKATFTITNFSAQNRIFEHDNRPVYRTNDKLEWDRFPCSLVVQYYDKKGQPMNPPPPTASFSSNNGGSSSSNTSGGGKSVAVGSGASFASATRRGSATSQNYASHRALQTGTLRISWSYKFRHADETVYFAMCYPYSYSHQMTVLDEWQKKFVWDSIPEEVRAKALMNNNNDDMGADDESVPVLDLGETPASQVTSSSSLPSTTQTGAPSSSSTRTASSASSRLPTSTRTRATAAAVTSGTRERVRSSSVNGGGSNNHSTSIVQYGGVRTGSIGSTSSATLSNINNSNSNTSANGGNIAAPQVAAAATTTTKPRIPAPPSQRSVGGSLPSSSPPPSPLSQGMRSANNSNPNTPLSSPSSVSGGLSSKTTSKPSSSSSQKATAQQQPTDVIYFFRETLCYSIENRRVELLTISGANGMGPDNEREPYYSSTVPVRATGSAERPHTFPDKQLVLFTARVHPGEVPGSHVLHGIIDFLLTSKDPRAVALRSKFVFKIVPMLNPDGVAMGHYRTDSRGVNLNRMYSEPDLAHHPTINATRTLFLALAATDRLCMYIDFHAHASKRGCFVFGNAWDDPATNIHNMLYPKLISLNTMYFHFPSCDFTSRSMSTKNKTDGMTKEGTGRVALAMETGLVHSFTLEVSYNMGLSLNPVVPLDLPGEMQFNGSQKTSSSSVGGGGSNTSKASSSPLLAGGGGAGGKYSPATYHDVGRGILVSLLDISNCNPISRLPMTQFVSTNGVRQWLERQVKQLHGEQARAEIESCYANKKMSKKQRNKTMERAGGGLALPSMNSYRTAGAPLSPMKVGGGKGGEDDQQHLSSSSLTDLPPPAMM